MRLALSFALMAGPALAETPAVVADMAPVHSLVAMVMEGVGAPSLAVPPGTSPHDASLRPSEAAALSAADVIVWTGPALLPWMEEAIASLAPEARVVTLLDAPGWERLPARESAHLTADAHDEEHESEEHESEEHHAEEEHHPDEAAEGHDHDHAAGGTDPHAWLDPAVAAAWLEPIAEALAAEDPSQAELYRANAAQAAERLLALRADLAARLSPLEGVGYAVGHDAYQYLERAAGLPASWAVAPADGAAPAPRNAAALREAIVAGEVGCLLLDAETDPGWAATLGEGTALRTATVDPDGVHLDAGPGLYPALIEGLAVALEGCLAPWEAN